jgi:hypothetical protein
MHGIAFQGFIANLLIFVLSLSRVNKSHTTFITSEYYLLYFIIITVNLSLCPIYK